MRSTNPVAFHEGCTLNTDDIGGDYSDIEYNRQQDRGFDLNLPYLDDQNSTDDQRSTVGQQVMWITSSMYLFACMEYYIKLVCCLYREAMEQTIVILFMQTCKSEIMSQFTVFTSRYRCVSCPILLLFVCINCMSCVGIRQKFY